MCRRVNDKKYDVNDFLEIINTFVLLFHSEWTLKMGNCKMQNRDTMKTEFEVYKKPLTLRSSNSKQLTTHTLQT